MHLQEAQRSTAPDGRQQALPHRRLQAHQAQRRVCACARHPSTAAHAHVVSHARQAPLISRKTNCMACPRTTAWLQKVKACANLMYDKVTHVSSFHCSGDAYKLLTCKVGKCLYATQACLRTYA